MIPPVGVASKALYMPFIYTARRIAEAFCLFLVYRERSNAHVKVGLVYVQNGDTKTVSKQFPARC